MKIQKGFGRCIPHNGRSSKFVFQCSRDQRNWNRKENVGEIRMWGKKSVIQGQKKEEKTRRCTHEKLKPIVIVNSFLKVLNICFIEFKLTNCSLLHILCQMPNHISYMSCAIWFHKAIIYKKQWQHTLELDFKLVVIRNTSPTVIIHLIC